MCEAWAGLCGQVQGCRGWVIWESAVCETEALLPALFCPVLNGVLEKARKVVARICSASVWDGGNIFLSLGARGATITGWRDLENPCSSGRPGGKGGECHREVAGQGCHMGLSWTLVGREGLTLRSITRKVGGVRF